VLTIVFGVKQGHQGIKVEIKMLLDQNDLLEQQKQNKIKWQHKIGRFPGMPSRRHVRPSAKALKLPIFPPEAPIK
jgi:hypothetical protein